MKSTVKLTNITTKLTQKLKEITVNKSSSKQVIRSLDFSVRSEITKKTSPAKALSMLTT